MLRANTKYPGDHVCKVFNILASSHVNNQENLVLEHLPKLHVTVLIDNDSFYNYARNLFNTVAQMLWMWMWMTRKS